MFSVSRYVTHSVVRLNFSTLPQFFDLLPLATALHTNDTDEEVVNCSINMLVVLAQVMSPIRNIPYGLEAIRKVAHGPFWSGRAVIAEFLAVFVFYNMPSFHSNAQWKNEVTISICLNVLIGFIYFFKVETMVLELMEDVQPEVRENSAKVLSGLLHCDFLDNPMDLLVSFLF